MQTLSSEHEQYGQRLEPVDSRMLPVIHGRSSLGRELDRWSARNSSKGALLAESIRCLQFLAEGHAVDELHKAIQVDDLLGKRTWEARRTYWRLISWRYLTPIDSPVVSALSSLASRGPDDPVLRGALYYHFCLADRLTFDISTDLVWELAQKDREVISPVEIEAYIRAGASQHPELLGWSNTTLAKLGSSIPSALRDFGRLSGSATKRLAQPPFADELLVYVCHFLSAEGKSARDIVTAPEYRLWGRTPQEIGTRLAKLSQSGVLRFQWSGDIAILDLGKETFETYARRLGAEVHRA